MANPFQGILLNGKYYGFDPRSYNRSYPLRNSTATSQNKRIAVSIQGTDYPIHTITLSLDNTYDVYNAATNAREGQTTWTGVSRLFDLINFVGAAGPSMPLTLVLHDGTTHLVVPTGQIDTPVFKPEAPDSNGIEYRASITFEDIS